MRVSAIRAVLIFCVVLLGGCAPRQYADIIAVTDPGYSVSGQSYELVPARQMSPEAQQQLAPIKAELEPALAKLGYTPAQSGRTADVRIEVAYGISGPVTTYTPTSYAWGNSTPGQFFYIPPTSFNTTGWPRAYDETTTYTRSFTLQAFKNTGQTTHSPLWAVSVESKGSVNRIDYLLPAMAKAAVPWLAQSGQSSTVLMPDQNGASK